MSESESKELPMSDTPQDAAVDRALHDHAGDADPVVESTQVLVSHHVPGAPLERKADAESSRAFEAELAEITADTHVNEHVVEYDGIDTRNPKANLATRSNIVPA